MLPYCIIEKIVQKSVKFFIKHIEALFEKMDIFKMSKIESVNLKFLKIVQHFKL